MRGRRHWRRWPALALLAAVILAGCSSAPLKPAPAVSVGDRVLHMSYGGREREYILHLPPAYAQGRPLPLVVVLHSGGGSPRLIEERTGMSIKADREGFIAVYPAGTSYWDDRFLTWNTGHCCFYALDHHVDDVGFVRKLILSLRDQLHVDRERIYVTGFSNGGMLAYYLGSTLPDVIAAIAPVSATMGGHAQPEAPLFVIPAPRAPLPVVTFHGLADQQIPYAGGTGTQAFEGRSDLSVATSLGFWLHADRCDARHPVTAQVTEHVRRYVYRCAAPGDDVELYIVAGMGHAWPRETRKGWRVEYALLDTPNNEVSATDLIWDFFRRHPKRPRAVAAAGAAR